MRRGAVVWRGLFLIILLEGALAREGRAVAAVAAPSKAVSPAASSSTLARLSEAPPAGVLAPDTRYATGWYVCDSGVAGPKVLIVGGVHGDETAGAGAAEQIRHWRVQRGSLLVIPRINVPALGVRRRNMPGVKTEWANLNRNFPRAGREEAPRGILATAVWARLKEWKPDWVIDLHEGFGVRSQTAQSVGSSLIPTADAETRRLAARMHTAINATIADPQKKFTLLRLPVDGSLARAAGAHLGAHAMILETTGRGQPLSLRVKQHQVMVRALLEGLGMMTADGEGKRVSTK